MSYGQIPLVSMLLAGSVLLAAETTSPPDDSVASGQQALQSRKGLPWYDAEQDGLRTAEVEPFEDDWKRQSDWAARSRNKSRSRRWGGPALRTFMRVLAWLALTGLVALVIWALIWGATRMQPEEGITAVAPEQRSDDQRMRDLPMPVASEHVALLDAAQAYLDAGDLGRAIIYAFAHQLVELDKHHLIQLTKGKTNREYLGELHAYPRFIELIRPTMLAFEDVFFGHHEISPQRFQVCWNNLDRFHQQLEQVA